MIKKILLLFVLLFSFSIFSPRAYAASEFATSYDVLYDVGEDGVTKVTEKVTLKNLTSESYASLFKLTVGATSVFEPKAQDPGGTLNITQEQKNTSTTLSVKFNQQVAGLGKILPWTISFKSKDFAEKVGRIWQVRVPKISITSSLENYNLTLAVPQSFGIPSSITPAPKNQTVSSGKLFLTFDMDQLKTAGISATFGAYQLFDFNLTFHLENNSLAPMLTNIALPPDTAYQDVIYQRIEPKPVNVTVDNDGNFLAWFRVNRSQKIDVEVFGSAKIYAVSKAKNPSLTDNLRKKYTESQKYWEKDHPQLLAKLNEIMSPEASNGEKVKQIYDFVVNFLKYDAGRLQDTDTTDRLGALAALNNPDSAVCMEFTDLFIALTRAAGIPSRELDGFAYTANNTLRPLSLTKDILHAWPEYFDDRLGWVMVDPTWEQTTGVDYFHKLDLNHFVFAIKGSSSSTPVAAGSYKFKGQDSQDVKVSLSDNDFLGKPQIFVQIDAPDRIWAGFPGKVNVKITNSGNAIYPSDSLHLTANNLLILNANGQKLGPIPPYGEAKFDFNIRTKSLFDSYDDQITLLVGSQKFTKDVVIKPFFLFSAAPAVAGVIVAAMILVYLLVLGRHVHSSRKKNRRKK